MTAIRESVFRTAARRGCAVAFSAALAVGLGAPPARAQTSHDHTRSALGSDYLTRSAAYNGYWDGFARGALDLKIGPDFNGQADETLLRAETGYSSDMGTLAEYQSAFRQAYGRGYSDAHSGRDRDPAMSIPPARPEPGLGGDGLDRTSLGVASASGYDAGYREGAADRTRGVSYEYRENEVYRAANEGYDPSLGDEERYRVVFRQIFARGYSDGFNGRARYTDTAAEAGARGLPRGGPAAGARRDRAVEASPAMEQAADVGYRNGYVRARYDRERGAQKANPQGHGAFHFALDGWEPKFGDRSAYRQEFRKNFVRGYDDGFHGRDSTPSLGRDDRQG